MFPRFRINPVSWQRIPFSQCYLPFFSQRSTTNISITVKSIQLKNFLAILILSLNPRLVCSPCWLYPLFTNTNIFRLPVTNPVAKRSGIMLTWTKINQHSVCWASYIVYNIEIGVVYDICKEIAFFKGIFLERGFWRNMAEGLRTKKNLCIIIIFLSGLSMYRVIYLTWEMPRERSCNDKRDGRERWDKSYCQYKSRW